ncbi:type II toxin-antitoxin system Xre/ParS family antitoxin [Photorhabdus australis]|uniref:type II RES/Xre toxin-antitoxin system antitoxin n=1 Tax=Photorhabdus australis TaxID=286156 RepID=UPI000566E01D|nr:antitoxin Xre/MbcA/ParS toxin-binding domain-containing protein [Photorhabdus australis]
MQVFTPSHKVQNPPPLWRTLGFPSSSGPHLNAVLNEGLPVTIVEKIQNWSTFGKGDILRIAGIQVRSYSRRCSGKGKFTADESQRIARFVRVMDHVVDLFNGDKDKATQWMKRPIRGLGYVTPESMLDTESGALDVMNLIGRIEHGIVS